MTERESRIFVPQPLKSDERLQLSGDQHHHLARVLRLRAGATVKLFDGLGGEYAATIEDVRREATIVRVGEHYDIERESPVPIRLAQGIGRGERTDYAIQKAVELGATSIVPLLTRRGVVRLDRERSARRHEHWRGIVVHACQQCGRNRIPELLTAVGLHEWLNNYQSGALDLLMDPDGEHGINGLDYRGGLVTLLVGPEGGLEGGEIDAAHAAGFRSLALGSRTLRTETAAVAGITAIQVKWGDLGAPA
ncbi:MAG: 16S rRNA (uracil(1498)-N(3))-methyltransferase [Gammaproteobacteria bacterium]|nr:16S rRNA (uracil(1498)-N(3))-methyltransferase [Gammaproteobacteria bacterium]NIM74039.1 16S rRNA (uracil(1498)-N(3))-methyltransferase [Gammaproteobacteria bacterium]NIN38921.1 16S rRNA (uracil(1498)-N(3))-methyltransferase [Gammaproteobacteria bacterium]NIO25814.1 16S rRNA (uracil(1498)-N(3))-methyltransferase [Gammaproteobacteria bacterium]NIO66445.1 16S rRNA (uracil(1498)-N(3))-methyltransferase [Gammaproteobacteria bacterium]